MTIRLLVNGLLDSAQRLAADAAGARGAVDGARQYRRHRAIEPQAHARLFDIAHMGFMLLGLLSGVVGGNWLNKDEAYAGAMFYTVIYVLMSLGAFGMLLYLSAQGLRVREPRRPERPEPRNPWYAFLMLIAMFSLAGVPPTAGFYAKLSVSAQRSRPGRSGCGASR
jgi:hypothetical protein